jgi:hypothetical protein
LKGMMTGSSRRILIISRTERRPRK